MEFDYTFDGEEPLDPGWEIVFDSGEDPPRIVMEVYRGGDRQEFIIRHRKA